MTNEIIISGKYTWIRPNGKCLIIGLNCYLLDAGEYVWSVDLPEPGDDIYVDDYFVTVETSKGLVEVFSPITGYVEKINEEVLANPDLINYSPYEGGWLVVARM
ncbi:MAG: glycine cleavage system protein H [Desulfobacterales bacterium]|nr:glycine cleavage system protein H [Desulfobacterales bacterium]